MSNPVLKSLIAEQIQGYLNESDESDLIESIFSEVSEETWNAIEEAILSEISHDTLKRYRKAAWDKAGEHYDDAIDAETDDEHDRHMAKGDKRMKGYELATAKTGLKPHQTYRDSGIDTIPNARVKASKNKK